jgi:hypothetical protein
VNKRSFATRKVYTKRPVRQAAAKKSGLGAGFLKKNAKTVLIWGLVVINVVLLGSLAKKILQPFSPGVNIKEQTKNAATVQVLNGCGAKGVANVFADALREKRYDVVAVGNADTFDYEKSVLINRGRVENKEVEKIASVLGVSKDRILNIESQTSQSDVDLIIGSDYQNLRAFRNKH